MGWGGPDTNGIRVRASNGDALAMIHMLQVVANFVFGGQERNRLFMCGSNVDLVRCT